MNIDVRGLHYFVERREGLREKESPVAPPTQLPNERRLHHIKNSIFGLVGSTNSTSQSPPVLCLLRDVSVSFRAGRVCAIMGPSGAGKTTLMDLIADRKYSGLRLGEINMDAGVDGNSGSFRLEADSESLSDDPGIGASDEEKGSETPRAASPRSRPHAKAEMKDLDHKRKSRGRRRKLSKLDIAYVQREDVHFGDFTVAQNLYFSALLRLGCGLSETELRSRCEEAAAAVGLSGAMDVKVGTELIKGISGGEKKRLSIATELLAFPAVICLDEPTTGLDSSTSLQLAECFNHLATSFGKTIICTVHQPSEDMLRCWHDLVLIADGRLAFSGPITSLPDFLADLGLNCGEESPVDFALASLAQPPLIDAMARASQAPESDSLTVAVDSARSTRSSNENVLQSLPYPLLRASSASMGSSTNLTEVSRVKLPFIDQVKVLCYRQIYFKFRSMKGLTAMILRNSLSCAILCLIYLNNGRSLMKEDEIVSPSGVMSPYCSNVLGVIFAITLVMTLSNGMAIPSFFAAKVSYTREQNEKMYSYLAYWLTMFLTDVPERLIFTFFVTSAVRAAVGLGGSYLTYHLTCMAVSLAGYGLALLCSWVVNDEVAALAVFSIISSFNVIFCGFLISAPNIDPYLRWLLHVAFTYWGVAQLEYNQFSGLKGMQGDAVLKYYDFEDRSLLPTCLVLMGFFVAFEVATAVCMRPQSKNVEHISMSDPRASELLSVAKSPHVVLPAPVVSEESFRAASDITRESVSKVKVNLKFSNIGYEITSEAKQKQILKGVSGTVDSGEVLAIMGSSGSGKTTLLNVIAGRVNQGRVTGSVTANGAPFLGFRQRNTDMPESQCSVSDFAYVMQDDVHIPCLTVRETLEFAAMLRLRVPQRSDARVQEAVSKVMQMLSLAKIADNLIGSSESRTISSGQLRRLSIGVGIVHDPMLVFLDEPTSGLDSYLASTVVEGMKTLALSGRTLLCAIHQPSAAVFHRFDKLLLLSQGHAIYFGQTSYCRAHFEALGYIFTQTNPADFALAVAHASAQAGLMNASETQPSEQPLYSTEALANLMCDRNESPHCIKETNDVESCGTDTSRTDIVSVEDIPVPFSVDNSGDEGTPSIVIAETDGIWSSALAAEWHDLRLAPVIICVLVKRDLLVILRKKILSRYSIRMFLFGVTLGLIWRDLADNDYLARMSLFLASYIANTVWLVELIPALYEDKVLFYRECDAQATSVVASWLSMGLVTAVATFLFDLLHCLPIYLLSGLFLSVRHFIVYLMAVYLLVVANMYLDHLIAAFSPSSIIHILLSPGLTVPLQCIFSGYIVQVSTLAPPLRPMPAINPLFWNMCALFQNEFNPSNDAVAQLSIGTLATNYGWTASSGNALCFIVAIAAVHKALTYLLMRRVKFSRI